MVSWLIQWLEVSIVRKSKLASKRHQRTSWTFLCTPKSAKLQMFVSVFSIVTDVPSLSTRLHEASWRHQKVILKTVLSHVEKGMLCILKIINGTKLLPSQGDIVLKYGYVPNFRNIHGWIFFFFRNGDEDWWKMTICETRQHTVGCRQHWYTCQLLVVGSAVPGWKIYHACKIKEVHETIIRMVLIIIV